MPAEIGRISKLECEAIYHRFVWYIKDFNCKDPYTLVVISLFEFFFLAAFSGGVLNFMYLIYCWISELFDSSVFDFGGSLSSAYLFHHWIPQSFHPSLLV